MPTLEMSLPSSSSRRITRRHSPPSPTLALLFPVASTLACTSLFLPCPPLESDSCFQRTRIRQQHQWAFPGGAVPGDRYQPDLGILSPDWPLSKGHGFRYQPRRQVRSVPGSCYGEYDCSTFCHFLLGYVSSGDKHSSCYILDYSVLHVSGSQSNRRWQHPDLPALKYHRAAG
jgi:hypothetical protein